MAKVPTIVPVTDLRQDAAKVLRGVKESGEPTVITQRGRAAAVLVSLEAYERAEKERQILLLIAQGEKEIRTDLLKSRGRQVLTCRPSCFKAIVTFWLKISGALNLSRFP